MYKAHGRMGIVLEFRKMQNLIKWIKRVAWFSVAVCICLLSVAGYDIICNIFEGGLK